MPLMAPTRVILLGSESGSAQTGVTTGTGTPVNVQSAQNLTVYVVSIGTVTAGAIQLEEADYPPDTIYSPAWAAIGSPIVAVLTSGGGQIVSRLTLGAYAYLRARVSTTVTGGTVLVSLRAW